jgi:SAM-dependent methyltransferase
VKVQNRDPAMVIGLLWHAFKGQATRKITRRNLDEFLRAFASEERVLDVGSGGSSYDGYFPNRLTVDSDPAKDPDLVADAHALPFSDAEFGLVLCTEVLEHVQEPRVVASELMRVLKECGQLVLTTRFVYPLHESPRDYWRFTRYGLEELFEDWTITTLVTEAKSFSALGVLVQRIAYQCDLRGGRATRFLLFALATVLDRLNWLLRREYGDIRRVRPEDDILTTGLYMVVQKRPRESPVDGDPARHV